MDNCLYRTCVICLVAGLRTIINALLKSMRQLVEVMTLIVFCLSVLALFALQVFMGELRNKCVEEWRSNQTDEPWITYAIIHLTYVSLNLIISDILFFFVGSLQHLSCSWVENDSHWLVDPSSNAPRLCGNLTGAWLVIYSCHFLSQFSRTIAIFAC